MSGRPPCALCGAEIQQAPGAINRAIRQGRPLYCDRICAGLARRGAPKTDDQRRAEKAEYDRKRREVLADHLREQKRAHYWANHEMHLARMAEYRADPLRQRYQRRYIASDRYRAWKQNYDRRHRAENLYGEEFADVALTLADLQQEIDDRADRTEIYTQNGRLNLSQQRKRAIA